MFAARLRNALLLVAIRLAAFRFLIVPVAAAIAFVVV